MHPANAPVLVAGASQIARLMTKEKFDEYDNAMTDKNTDQTATVRQKAPTNPITPNQCPTCGAFGLDWQKEAIATSKRQLEAWQKMQSVAQQKETELRHCKAHADKLAEALRDMLADSRSLETRHYAKEMLAAYEEAKQ